jgi:hypothetical protein
VRPAAPKLGLHLFYSLNDEAQPSFLEPALSEAEGKEAGIAFSHNGARPKRRLGAICWDAFEALGLSDRACRLLVWMNAVEFLSL